MSTAENTVTRTISLAHSPDSDDLVMWWPLIGIRHPDGTPIDGPLGKPQVDTHGFTFDLDARDVEELNKIVVGNEDTYDITAISCAAYPAIHDRYAMTRSGGSFGEGYGPKVVVHKDSGIANLHDLKGKRIAIPGKNTSAFLTLQLAIGQTPATEMLFSDIPSAVERGDFDAGVLIHEAQLTYMDSNLHAIADLGQWWGEQHNIPLPLGLNVVARSLDDRFGEGTLDQVGRILDSSVQCAVNMPEASRQYLQLHKGDRTEWDDPELVDRYLAMYVSQLTIDMGDTGLNAIKALLKLGSEKGYVPTIESFDVIGGVR